MRIAASVISLFFYLTSTAQQYDAQWMFGSVPTSVLDFRNDTVSNYAINKEVFYFLTMANICDENGSLLFTTTGTFLADRYGDTLQNGDSLNPCRYTWDNPGGLDLSEGALFVPKPGNNRYYYLFHCSADTLNDGRPGTLYYSIIDKEGNFGLGNVIKKNYSYCKGIFHEGGMTACKHANGRDYWIIIGEHGSNRFFKFLLTPDTLLGPFIQSIGIGFPGPYDLAYSKFSQDGSKYATGILDSKIEVLDFDRCTGDFSNPVTIYNESSPHPATQHTSSGCVAMEFSPNGRYLYVSDNINLNQYDLTINNGQDSVELYMEDTLHPSGIDMLQLAPNGKIYGSAWSGGFYLYHVINYPDLPGLSANFIYGGLPVLSANSDAIPNMINYKLGPLVGSGCDTITSVTDIRTRSQEPRIIPNPADKYAYVEMSMQGNYAFELINEAGQIVDRKETRQIDIFDTEQLCAGVYFIRVTDKNIGAEMVTKKLMVVH